MQPSRELNLDLLHREVASCSIGHLVDYHRSVASTMPIAHALARQPDVASGALVVAEKQTSGRGRLQRSWETPHGVALLTSFIIKPPHLPANPWQLPMLAGLAVRSAIIAVCPECDQQAGLKWPNDILLGPDFSRAAKVAGILVETSYLDGEMSYAILGIGINVNQQPSELPAISAGAPQPTSLSIFVGHEIDRTILLAALCQQIERYVQKVSPEELFAQWRAILYTLGQRVVVNTRAAGEETTLIGIASDVTADGELILESDTGDYHHISVGDVTSVRTP
ncbi:MAG: biotin--[acetyl-CoA-carboxylase] ligase [Caldilineaceae bacterium]|nr:biotin--[acetyl-CoA-carboxylase] ligase [Caldilineaceae bacterium]